MCTNVKGCSNDYQGLPTTACAGGIRSNILFPT